MDALFLPLANVFGASVDHIKVISCLLITYPLGSLFVRIPSSAPALRHLFNITVTIIFVFPVFRIYTTVFQLLASILATYFVVNHHKGKNMPWVVFVIVMGHLTVNHVIRAVYGSAYGMMRGPQMVLATKLTTFAWNVYDGRRKLEDLDKWQTAKRITKYPSLLEFLAYSFYFPGILYGPSLDFSEYMDLVNETTFKSAQVKAKIKSGHSLPPGRNRAAYTKMFLGLVYLCVFVLYNGKYNHGMFVKPEFMKHGLFMRIWLFQVVGPVERAKYYAIWTLTEGASIITGLGFTGFNAKGEPQWDGAANIKVIQTEFPPSPKHFLDAWNMKTNVWLRECVYKRVTPKGKKPGLRSILITSFTSAFWHGLSSGYYLTFFMLGFITAVARLARSDIRPLLLPPASNPSAPPSLLKRTYDLFGVLLSILLLNYAVAPFPILSARNSLLTWGTLGWYGHVIVIGALVFFYAGGSRFLRGLQKAKGILPPTRTNAAVPVQNETSKALVEKTFTPPLVDTVIPPIS